MSPWSEPDWNALFHFSQPVLETIIRGTCMYLALFALLRTFRRQTGQVGPADLLVLLLLADAAQNGLAGEYRSITDGVILVATIVGWEYAVDWLAFRSKHLRGLLEHSSLPLVVDGKVQTENLHRELMSTEELMAGLRKKGIDDISRVRLCSLEGDGDISVLMQSRPSREGTGQGV